MDQSHSANWTLSGATPESRDITTFAVHTGTYKYKRLIFGVSSASEEYQHEIATAFARIEGIENISVDIIVHAPDQETHEAGELWADPKCREVSAQYGQACIHGHATLTEGHRSHG